MAEEKKKGLLDNKFGDALKGLMIAGPPGLFAGGMIRKSRERRELKNELMRGKLAAQEELTGLLGQTSRTVVQPPSAAPQSPDGLNEIVPLERRDVPTYQTPAGQQQLLGIMSKINPEEALKAALPSSERSNTTDQKISALMTEARRRGLGPEETDAFIDANLARGGDPMMQMLAAEQLRQRELDNAASEREAATGAEALRKNRASREVAINDTLRGVGDIASNNSFLNGTILRPGWGADTRKTGIGAWEQIKRAAGGDTSEEQAMLQAYGDFEKGTANLLNDLLPQLDGIDAGTDSRLRQIQKSLAGVGNEPGTNAKILSETIYDILNIAKINDFAVPNTDQWTGLAENLRSFNKQGVGSRSVTMPDGSIINNVPLSVTDEQLNQQYQQRQ